MVSNLEKLHELGNLYLDLKPDNILLGSDNRGSKESSEMILIDFGFSKRWKDKRGNHIEECQAPFVGNVLFGSHNGM